MTNNINGIDVSESVLTATNNDVCYSQNAVDELLNKIKRLQEENEELKARLKILDDEVLTVEITLDEFEKIKKYKQTLEEIRSYCDEQNLKADYTACYITNRIDEVLNDRD